MAENRGMGRGLAAILPTSQATGGDELRELAVELIVPNPRQPRTVFDEQDLAALSTSVAERGILQPIVVRPIVGGSFELIAGERRLRAARMAGLATVPAVVRGDVDADTLELALIENMARTDLNPVDEARACAALVEDLGLSKEEVGRRVGRSRVAVSNLIRLLNLPEDVLELIELGELTEGHGRALLRAPRHEDRREFARRAVAEGWSVRTAELMAEQAATERDAGEQEIGQPANSRQSDAADISAVQAELQDMLDTLGLNLKVKVKPDGKVAINGRFASIEQATDFVTHVARK